MLSAISFNSDQSKISPSGNGLTLLYRIAIFNNPEEQDVFVKHKCPCKKFCFQFKFWTDKWTDRQTMISIDTGA